MDVRLINPFLNATINVLETMANVSPKPGKPYLKTKSDAVGVVTGVIALSGIANGTISVTFDKKSICNIVSNLFGEKITKVDEEVEDAVGELTNMISGKARQELELLNLPLQAGIPKITSGEGHKVEHYNDEPKIALPFTTEKGEFTVEICMERKTLEAAS